jgi:hypothetical protein
MSQTKEEAALAKLEGPRQEAQNAAHDLATLKTLIDTVPHEGAKAAMQRDLAVAEQRAQKAAKAVVDSAVTQQEIDQAAQAVIDARED